MKKTNFKLIILILIALLIAMIAGCCHYREYYPNGTLKKEFHGVEFSDKTINI